MAFPAIERINEVQESALDAFMALSRAYLLSAQQLSALNAAALRSTITEGMALTDRLARATTMSDIQSIQSDMTATMMSQATNYSVSMNRIAAEAQGAVHLQAVNAAQVTLVAPLDPAAVQASLKSVVETVGKGVPSFVPTDHTALRGNGSKPAKRQAERRPM